MQTPARLSPDFAALVPQRVPGDCVSPLRPDSRAPGRSTQVTSARSARACTALRRLSPHPGPGYGPQRGSGRPGRGRGAAAESCVRGAGQALPQRRGRPETGSARAHAERGGDCSGNSRDSRGDPGESPGRGGLHGRRHGEDAAAGPPIPRSASAASLGVGHQQPMGAPEPGGAPGRPMRGFAAGVGGPGLRRPNGSRRPSLLPIPWLEELGLDGIAAQTVGRPGSSQVPSGSHPTTLLSDGPLENVGLVGPFPRCQRS